MTSVSLENLEGVESNDMSNSDMIHIFKEIFTSSMDNINEKVDNLKSDMNNKFAELEPAEFRHHTETTVNQKSTEEKITTRFDQLEKTSKKRANELEKKIDMTNKKLTAQVQKNSETE